MSNRIIKESINESRSLSELSFFATDLYKRLITYADDYGRFNADYQIILARLYPREMQIVNELDIEDALIELSGAKKIGFYTSNSKKEIYGCFPNWNEHQRVRDSKKRFPDPDDGEINDWYLRRFVPLKLKQRIIERDGFKCKICGKYVSTVKDSYRLIKMGAGLFHIDHIVPVIQGGRATEENLQLTCQHCNLSRKKLFSVEEILEITLKNSAFAESCGELPQVAANCGELPPESNPIQYNPNPNTKTMCKADALALFEQLWELYPVKKGKGQVSDAKKMKLLEIGLDEMSRAIKRYLAGLEKDSWRKPQNGSTFFNSGYVDYLDCNYAEESKSVSEKVSEALEAKQIQESEDEELLDEEEWWNYGPNADRSRDV